MKRLNSQKGITLIALIVTIIVLVIIAGISIATLTADNGILRQTNLAKVENIEAAAREQVKLAVGAMRLAIAEAQSLDNSYKASDNRDKIKDVLLSTIQADTTALEKDGWSSADDTANSFKITYAGDDYKNACNDDNAEIVYTITLGQKSIEITNETNATLKDQNGNDVNLDIGGNTGSGSGSGSGEGSGGGTQEPVALAAGLYDANNQLVASWDELVNTYGMDVTKLYTSSTYKTDTASPYYILTNNAELANGVKLIIGEGPTTISKYAFRNCTNLADLTIPDSVTSIEDHAFRGCTSLKVVTFSGNSQLESIGYYAFGDCASLTRAELPNGMTSVGQSAFTGCTNLAEITVPDSVTTISDRVFYNCTSLKSITFGENSQLTSIGEYAFNGCSNLTNITIPDSVTSIDTYAFSDCSNLKTVYYEGTFEQWCNFSFDRYANPCSNGAVLYINGELIDDLVIPNTITELKNNAFFNCKSLISVTFGENSQLTTISQNAFYNCTNLTSITIPNSVTIIDGYAFYLCTNLTTVTFGENSQLTTIGDWAFYGCTSLESITIPDSVTTIGTNVFQACTNLTSITISGTTSMGYYAFYQCTNLTNVTILATEPPTLGASVFNGCSNLTTITVPVGCADAYKAATNWSTWASKIVEAQ